MLHNGQMDMVMSRWFHVRKVLLQHLQFRHSSLTDSLVLFQKLCVCHYLQHLYSILISILHVQSQFTQNILTFLWRTQVSQSGNFDLFKPQTVFKKKQHHYINTSSGGPGPWWSPVSRLLYKDLSPVKLGVKDQRSPT